MGRRRVGRALSYTSVSSVRLVCSFFDRSCGISLHLYEQFDDKNFRNVFKIRTEVH